MVAPTLKPETPAMSELAKKKCVPCQGGVPALRGPALEALHRELAGEWKVLESHHLEKEFEFKAYKDVIGFVNKVAGVADQEGHHPEMHVAFRKVTVRVWTHKIDGLTESDFVFAAKVDQAR